MTRGMYPRKVCRKILYNDWLISVICGTCHTRRVRQVFSIAIGIQEPERAPAARENPCAGVFLKNYVFQGGWLIGPDARGIDLSVSADHHVMYSYFRTHTDYS